MLFFGQNRKKRHTLIRRREYHQLHMYVVLGLPLTTTCPFLFGLFFWPSQTTKPLLGYGLKAVLKNQEYARFEEIQPHFRETFLNSRGTHRRQVYVSKKHHSKKIYVQITYRDYRICLHHLRWIAHCRSCSIRAGKTRDRSIDSLDC